MQRRISPRTNVFSHSFYASTWRSKEGERLDNGVGWTISNQTPDSVRVSNERSHGFCSRGFVSKIINHERRRGGGKRKVAGKIDSI